MFKIINRYILKEISFPFFMTLFVFTFVLLMGKILQLMDLMVNKGVSFIDISKLVFFLMPSFLVFTIPTAFLISILIGLGRLSGDNEITIFKASGISLYQLLFPIAFASLITFIITAVITFFLVPHSNYATRNLLFDIARQKASIGIKEKVFNDDFKNLVLYAEKVPVHGNFMEGVIVFDNQMGKEPNTIIARKGYLVSDPDTLTVVLRLEKGSTHTVDKNLKSYKKMDFSTYDVNLDLKTAISEKKRATAKKSKEMTFWELSKKIKNSDLKETALRELAIEFHKKLSIPLSCIIFGILGIPLGMRENRSGKSRGFTVGLLVVLIYYMLQLCGEGLGETGKLPPAIGVWAPNLIFGAVGIYIFIMAAKEKLPGFGGYAGTLKKLIANWKGWRP
ncbi:MAG: LPS export ABC transporter permease LptF [Thermodesulfobacteriota bacterium]|nr:LPS export ABC transporter permease LptF [Thermodesulfobacteriota bacterium]